MTSYPNQYGFPLCGYAGARLCDVHAMSLMLRSRKCRIRGTYNRGILVQHDINRNSREFGGEFRFVAKCANKGSVFQLWQDFQRDSAAQVDSSKREGPQR